MWLLLLNPGFKDVELECQRDPAYRTQKRLALTGGARYPFWPLDPALSHTPGGRYWAGRLNAIVAKVGRKRTATGLVALQFHGYPSREFKPLPGRLPSQDYIFQLLRRAIRQEAVVVVMRGLSYWTRAVPELADYGYLTVSSWRNPRLTPQSLSDAGYARLIRSLLKPKS